MIIGCVTLVPLNKHFDRDLRQVAAISCAKGRGITLPGGKWEEGELFEEAARREFLEETGFKLFRLPSLLYQGYCELDNYCYTFIGECSGFWSGFETTEGVTQGAYWEDLLKSHFKCYYSLLRQHCEKLGYVTGV